MRKLNRLIADSERGAISIIFAVLLSSGFLFVALAMTSDASALYLEKRSQKNAADAASLAVASNCGLGTSNCSNEVSSKNEALNIANLNSPDGIAAIKSICGYTPLTACPSSPLPVGCKSIPSNIQRYARIVLSTKNQNNSTRVSSPFFNFFLGNSNSEIDVNACSQAAWGKANSATISIPLAISICDYLTEGYKILRDYSTQMMTCPSIIKDSQGLTINPQPQKVIDGWAVFSKTGLDLYCLQPSQISIGVSLQTLPPGQERCKDIGGGDSKNFLISFIASNLGKKVFIPVIASTSGTGTGNAQVVSTSTVGFFTFIFLGYNFGPQQRGGCGVSGANCVDFVGQSTTQCGSQRSCIWGKFTKGIVPGVPVSRDNSFPPVGAVAVELMQ